MSGEAAMPHLRFFAPASCRMLVRQTTRPVAASRQRSSPLAPSANTEAVRPGRRGPRTLAASHPLTEALGPCVGPQLTAGHDVVRGHDLVALALLDRERAAAGDRERRTPAADRLLPHRREPLPRHADGPAIDPIAILAAEAGPARRLHRVCWRPSPADPVAARPRCWRRATAARSSTAPIVTVSASANPKSKSSACTCLISGDGSEGNSDAGVDRAAPERRPCVNRPPAVDVTSRTRDRIPVASAGHPSRFSAPRTVASGRTGARRARRAGRRARSSNDKGWRRAAAHR